MNSSGERAQPFWSSRSRIERVRELNSNYADFEPVETSWEDFRDKWLPGLHQDGLLVGVNWSGANVTGYDIDPSQARDAIEALLED